uniref:Family with sequence similarity 180 member A n=1 Tax=Myripristis murdjan TaxID=586833 RepID=A0A668AR45_9TELE
MPRTCPDTLRPNQMRTSAAPPVAAGAANLWMPYHRIKRGTHSLINPTFQRSVDDVILLFEILLAGLQIEGEEQAMQLPDDELASLRSVEKLEVICEDVLPKRLSDIRRLTAELAHRKQSLSRQDFERTVLTMVYAAQTLAHTSHQLQRDVWADALLQLFRAIQKDLAPP